jgi:arylsulfatase A-like enzyme/Tfp pilus assembly protein PilF
LSPPSCVPDNPKGLRNTRTDIKIRFLKQRGKVKATLQYNRTFERDYFKSAFLLCFIIFFGMTLFILGFGKGQSLPAVSRSASMNILLITLDTLRADYLSCYGGKKVRTPQIDRIAEQGILFERAFAHNVVTLPSHINILTGTYPLYHGVQDNAGFRLDEDAVILSEVLKQEGYRTGAFIGAFPLDDRFGLDQGFDLYDDYYGDTTAQNVFSFVERRAEDVVRRAVEWMNQNREESWFCWVHIYDPHAPYDPPPSFRERYPRNLYAGEVAYSDFALGNLFEFLKEAELEENTLVVLTSDHGEGLGEHQEPTHGVFAYNTTLHIPLIVYQPKLFPEHKVVSRRVRHIDIMPTVLDIAGFKIPKEVQGHSLVPVIRDPRKGRSEDCYFEAMTPHLNRDWAPLQGVLSDQFKYIDLPIKELYDAESDYKEEYNLAAKDKSTVEKLNKRLQTLIKKYSSKTSGATRRVREDPETLEKLRALGYVSGSSQKSSTRIYTQEDDPKKLIDLDNMSHTAIDEYLLGNPSRAIELFNEVIERRPTMGLAYSQLSFVYHETGQMEKAIQTLEKGLALNLSNRLELMAKLGIYLQEKGQFKRSIDILEAVLKEDPDHAEALNYLGISYWRSGQYDKAVSTFEVLIVLDKGYASAYNNLGSVYLSQKKYELAAEQFVKALKYDARLAGPYNGLGVVYASRGDNSGAIENWRKAVELDNQQYDALYNLGILLVQVGRFEEAVDYLERFIQTAPPLKYEKDIEKMKELVARIKKNSR